MSVYEAEARDAEVGRPQAAALLARRLFPGVLPPRPFGVDGVVRQVLVALVAFLAVVGLVAYLVRAADNPALAAPLAVGVAGGLAGMVIPWHRLAQDAFAGFSIAFTLWVSWFIYATGGATSTFMPLTYLAVVVAVPLSQRTGIVVGTAAAVSAALPFVYQRVEQADAENILVRLVVLATAAVFATWLMAELRRAVLVAATRQERLEDEQEASAQLRRSQSAREEYVSVLAHEMRNPLNAIGAAARVLAREIADKPGEQTAHAIATEAHHALELVDGLTDVASLESGRMRFALRPIDLAAIVRETAAATVDQHRVVVRGAEQPMAVLGDDRRLGQVIRNLLSNAGKYSPADSEIQVSLGVSADRRSAIVQVHDAGPGIPPSERGRLFQKFARLSTAGGTRGSGLGLFISRGIVHDHGGELWADWPPGGGSVFSFRVPLMGDERRKSERTVTP